MTVKTGYIPKSKFHSVFIRSDYTEQLIDRVFNQTKEIIRKEKRKQYDSNLRTCID